VTDSGQEVNAVSGRSKVVRLGNRLVPGMVFDEQMPMAEPDLVRPPGLEPRNLRIKNPLLYR
jgi:hypothetical protein